MNISSNTHVSISIVGDEEMRKLNKEYLNRDYATDVLSFNVGEQSEQGFYLGDIVVNKDQDQRQAAEFENSLEEEISELVAHGMLHLLGVHHEGDEH